MIKQQPMIGQAGCVCLRTSLGRKPEQTRNSFEYNSFVHTWSGSFHRHLHPLFVRPFSSPILMPFGRAAVIEIGWPDLILFHTTTTTSCCTNKRFSAMITQFWTPPPTDLSRWRWFLFNIPTRTVPSVPPVQFQSNYWCWFGRLSLFCFDLKHQPFPNTNGLADRHADRHADKQTGHHSFVVINPFVT